MDRNHSERNSHRLFNKFGLALRVPISFLEVPPTHGDDGNDDAVTVPYLSVKDFMQHLLCKHEHVLFGGLSASACGDLLSTFWARFRGHHKQHRIFSELSYQERSRAIPVMLHGDKGRTLQKSPIFILSFQVPFGLPPSMLQRCAFDEKRSTRHVQGNLTQPCSSRGKKRRFQEVDFSECTRNAPKQSLDASCPTSHQRHNNRGHSYLSRFLICAVPAKMFKKNPNVLPNLLKQVAQELTELFNSGLKHNGETFRVMLIGAKGDAEWHFEAGQFNRSYHNSGPRSNLQICPLCSAGEEGLPYTDVSKAPQWLQTVGASNPWDDGNEPPLLQVPFSRNFPANVYKCDPFHILKFGIFRDCAASCIIRLAVMQYFDADEPGESTAVPERLQRAFSYYHMWTLACKKCSSLKGFTRANLNYMNTTSFAWINAKGSEVTLLFMWLDHQITLFLRNLKQEGDRRVLQAMLQTIQGGLAYVGTMHSHGLWLPICCAKVQLDAGYSFARGYAWLAEFCTRAGASGFRLRPKLHYFMHLLMPLQAEIDSGKPHALNAAIWLCEADEDFVGRIARVSRRVHARTASVRTIQRYLVKVRLMLEKLKS